MDYAGCLWVQQDSPYHYKPLNLQADYMYVNGIAVPVILPPSGCKHYSSLSS